MLLENIQIPKLSQPGSSVCYPLMCETTVKISHNKVCFCEDCSVLLCPKPYHIDRLLNNSPKLKSPISVVCCKIIVGT